VNPLDVMMARGVRAVLEEDLGRSTYRKIETEVQKMYGISVLDAAADFAKLDLVLRRFFGKHTTGVEVRVFSRILSAKGSGGEADIVVREPSVAGALLESYGNPAKRVILDALQSPQTLTEAIATAGLPKASTYNRARDLLRDGLLVISGHSQARDGRRVTAYVATLTGITFESRADNLTVSARMPMDIALRSYAFSSVVV
jgi:hypothetical protein